MITAMAAQQKNIVYQENSFILIIQLENIYIEIADRNFGIPIENKILCFYPLPVAVDTNKG